MTEQLLNSHWYRIAETKLSLPRHIRVHRHNYRKTVWYVLRDEITGKHHRFNQASYNFIRLIDGQHTVNDIWEMLNEELGDDAPTQDEVMRLLGTLHFADFLHADTTVDIQQLIDRRVKQRKQLFKTKFGNPLALRFSLLDPDRFLNKYMRYVSPLFTRTAGLIALCVVIFSVLQMVRNWELLSNHAMESALTPDNLFLMWLVYPVIKLIHELGHGFAVKRWGGDVHELGIMILVLMPVPYVDASAASSFRSKYKRMLVGAAGIIVELLLASIALLIWLNVQQGVFSDILFNVMLIGGASTILFNGNPLLKFDGYFVLADALEIPGLGPRANKYYGYLIQRYLFNVQGLDSPVLARGESFWFLSYGAAAFVYRLILIVVITLFVASQYFFIGILLAIWAIFMQAVMPVIKWLRHLFGSPVLMQKRGRAILLTATAMAGVTAVIFMIPVPLNTVTEGVVWMPEKSHVRATADGFVDSVLVGQGEHVSSGSQLIVTSDPLIQTRHKLLNAQYRELKIKHAALVEIDIVQADITLDEMNLMQGKIARLEEQISELVMTSPQDGSFVMSNASDIEGVFVRQGDPVAYVINYDEVNIRAVVPQNAIGLVRQNVEDVEIRFVDDLNLIYKTHVSREIPAATYKLPSKALSQQGGGNIQTDPFDTD
ncbi:MAG: efflux RND transporter periplasmic adaptor subunit, partial [Gammaproteobacteria bacterium]|nr:efflux RND transporter periplasmic adaptor subunit [Gammaproteobacteria bacterium]